MSKTLISQTTRDGGIPMDTLILEEDPTDTIHPSFDRHALLDHQSPEHALAFAVLTLALRVLTTTPLHKRKQKEFVETYEWLFTNEDDGHPFNFRNLCDYLGFSPPIIQRGITALLTASKKLVFREAKRGMLLESTKRARRGGTHLVKAVLLPPAPNSVL